MDKDDASLMDRSIRLSEIENELDESTHSVQSEKERLVQGQTRSVLYLKVIVVVVLIVAGIGLSLFAYYKPRNNEIQEFENVFKDTADKLITSFLKDINVRVWTTASLSTAYTSFALATNMTFPNVTLPHYQRRSRTALRINEASGVAFAPLLTEGMRESWEAYARESQYLFEQEYDDAHQDNMFTRDKAPMPDYIWEEGGNSKVRDEGPEPFSPVWQIAPDEKLAKRLLYNQMRHPEIKRALNAMILCRGPVMSEIIRSKQDTPASMLVVPVFESFLGQQSIVVGSISMQVQWKRYFDELILPEGQHMIAVLENTCGQTVSFRIGAGEQTFLVDQGDRHNSRYDDLFVASDLHEFEELLSYHSVFSYEHGNHSEPVNYPFSSPFLDSDHHDDIEHTHCAYRFRIYPDEHGEDVYLTNRPARYAGLIGAVFGFAILIFVIYDYLVERRQSLVKRQAEQSYAIIRSLFPAVVRDRLFKTTEEHQDETEQASTPTRKLTRRSSFIGRANFLPMEAPTIQLRNYLSHTSSSKRPLGEDQPIADLFPSVTIFFADIVRFTAWSSEREPYQVFQLLETLYSAFDKVARALGVFKVETIGDSYVAVCGLPEPREDHAVVMARFAYECLHKMQETAKQLEVMLGPGTAELDIRIGLHSGPVTAGVLRGEKSRFQLFGDSVNTTARMEQTGESGKIQVSKETADLLIASGKGHWVTPRENLVSVKGKGNMATFWLEPASRRSPDSPKGNLTENGSPLQLNQPRTMPVTRSSTAWVDIDIEQANGYCRDSHIKTTLKDKRLIDWNVELLYSLLLKVVARRQELQSLQSRRFGRQGSSATELDCDCSSFSSQVGTISVLEEVTEVIELPDFNPNIVQTVSTRPENVEIDSDARKQLRDYVTRIASLYRSVPFHNLEHASHVTMSANKLMKRIIAPNDLELRRGKDVKSHDIQAFAVGLHKSTFGIGSDPLTQFAIVFSALIHDVDHTGVPNAQLVKEKAAVAIRHHNKSVAEQESVHLGWEILMESRYETLRSCIYASEAELKQFRQLVVNSVLATDIIDKNLQSLRKDRWLKAFQQASSSTRQSTKKDRNRKATIVIEHIIQASDVAHTMQHWRTFRKWNERLFEEQYRAFLDGRAEKDPSTGWYEGEIGFFDHYVIPLAKKLKECGVFGVSSDEYLAYALENRREWEEKGQQAVQEMVEKFKSGVLPEEHDA